MIQHSITGLDPAHGGCKVSGFRTLGQILKTRTCHVARSLNVCMAVLFVVNLPTSACICSKALLVLVSKPYSIFRVKVGLIDCMRSAQRVLNNRFESVTTRHVMMPKHYKQVLFFCHVILHMLSHHLTLIACYVSVAHSCLACMNW